MCSSVSLGSYFYLPIFVADNRMKGPPLGGSFFMADTDGNRGVIEIF